MQSIRRQLNRLRGRERWLQFAWLGARWLAMVAILFTAACFTDWLIDLWRDTPMGLRIAMFAVQAFVWLIALMTFGVLLSRRPSDAEVSLWVEDRTPALGHRLISAVQLNRPGAQTAGMSAELIATVTREAEELSSRMSFAAIADGRRLRWAAGLGLPVILGAGLCLFLWPDTVGVLVARQFLANRTIPRSVTLAAASLEQVLPAGETVSLDFHVTGAGAHEGLRGEVLVVPDNRPSEAYEMVFDRWLRPGEAVYVARVPSSATDFSFHAWLKDGRTHQPAHVHFEARPVVQKQEAWVRLPARVSLRPTDQPYEEPQRNGEITRRFAGSTARVAIVAQKPLAQATLEILGPVHPLVAAAASPQVPGETVRRTAAMTVDDARAQGLFELDTPVRPEFLALCASGPAAGIPWAALLLSSGPNLLPAENGYRIVVRDQYGLVNADPPRRSMQQGTAEPPEVVLLPELFWKEGDEGPVEEREVEGIPVLLGQRMRIEYSSAATYGLDRARVRYRVVKKGAAGEESGPINEDEFLPLPLGAPAGRPASRKALEEFTAFPANEPGELSGTRGGGRYDFDSTGIPDGQGGLILLQPGDRIQFFVEVFGRADPNGRPGRSILREKEVVSIKDFLAWLERKEDQKERIRQLEEKQRGRTLTGVMEKPLPTVPAPPENTRPPNPPEQPVTGEAVLGRSWEVLGVFPGPNDSGHATAYPPETSATDLGKEYPGLNGPIRWQTYHSPTDLIDFKKFFRHADAGVAYAVCWVDAGRRSVWMSTGSDDGIKVWLNRGLVLDKAVHRPAIPGEDRTSIELAEGWNEILVKVDNRLDNWGFYFDLLDKDTGKQIENAKVRLTPPPEQGRKYVRDWRLIGPFRLPGNNGRTQVYPPEQEEVQPGKEYEGRYAKVGWKEFRSPSDKIDVLKALGLGKDKSVGIAYAVCWVRCDDKRPALVVAGSEGGVRVWINRRQVLDRGSAGDDPQDERAQVELTKGWNEILVKLDNPFGNWIFWLELRDPTTGRPLERVEYRVSPP